MSYGKEEDQKIFSANKLDHECLILRNFWRAVLAQAVRDLTDHDPIVVLESMEWYTSRSFNEVCDLAGVNPSWVAEDLDQALQRQEPYRRYFILQLVRKINVGLLTKKLEQ